MTRSRGNCPCRNSSQRCTSNVSGRQDRIPSGRSKRSRPRSRQRRRGARRANQRLREGSSALTSVSKPIRHQVAVRRSSRSPFHSALARLRRLVRGRCLTQLLVLSRYYGRNDCSVMTERVWAQSDTLDDLSRMRGRAPLTHCITNIVAANFTANVLLAVGASPAMVVATEEVAEFAAIAAAVLINVGTVTNEAAKAMRVAAAAARESGTPWVLDPVAVGAVRFRTQVATGLLAQRPAIVRGNASEILALSGFARGG